MDQFFCNALPSSCEWYREQIAGHHPSVIKNGERQIGLIKEIGTETLLKPVQDGIRGICEATFYGKLRHRDTLDREENVVLTKFATFAPEFHGLKTVLVGAKRVDCLIIDDLTNRYKYPCVMDIKVGKVTYDPNAPRAKRLSEAAKYPEQEILGFRLTGYRMRYGEGDTGFRVRDKKWGRTRNLCNIVGAFGEFLSARFKEETAVAEEALKQLYEIKKWFTSQRLYHFYASSILIAYEGCKDLPQSVVVKLIDFSHVFPAYGYVDGNYLFGLNNVIKFIESYRESLCLK